MNNYTHIVREKVIQALDKYSMIENVKCVVVGFSGGADSLCLLHILNSISDEKHFRIVAAHVNHGIRGDEAERDSNFCHDFCRQNNIPFKLLVTDCVTIARERGLSVEECGRNIRYDFFGSLCENDFYRIATAHNANDNAETLLFNLARGTGLKGASGIPRFRDGIIRPLIFCTREEIEGYCRENDLHFVTDSTNLCDDYTRNRIRHDVLPAICRLNSGAVKNLNAFTEKISEINDFIRVSVSESLKCADLGNGCFDSEFLLSLHSALLSECIIEMFSRVSDKVLDSQKIDAVKNLFVKKGRCQIFGDIYAEVVKNKFRFFKYIPARDDEVIIDLSLDKEICFNNYTVILTNTDNCLKKVNKKLLDNFVDCDKIDGSLKLRARREGDTITLGKRKITKSLKKLFNELGVPVEKRGLLPVLSDETGVVWVYSIGVTERCRPDENSQNIIIVEGEQND